VSVRAPLRERLRDPGYTPGSRDVGELFTLLAVPEGPALEPLRRRVARRRRARSSAAARGPAA